MRTVLFVCVRNSARSQMAEAFLNNYGKEEFVAESAGLEPGKLNPYVIEVMQEIGIDIRNNKTTGVFDLFKQGKKYDAVVKVCDAANSERCPVFPGITKRIAWSFPDPPSFIGISEENLEKTRKVRDEISEKIRSFINETKDFHFWL